MRVRLAPPLSLLLLFGACDALSRSASRSPPSSPERSPAPAATAAEASAPPAPLADTSRAEIRLLRVHGWTPVRLVAEDTLRLPVPVTQYLQTKRYLEASQMIGLDFSSRAGRTLRVVTYRVRGRSAPEGSVRAHLLRAEAEVVGAWLSVEDRTPGIYPLSFDPYAP